MATRLLYQQLAAAAPGRPSAVTVGTFDGVHRGHQFLIRRLQDRAQTRGLASGVVVLHPHPLTVVRPGTHVTYLTDLDERIELIAALGVDAVIPLTFTHEVSQVDAEEFVLALVDALQVRFLLVGPDAAIGRGREGAGDRLVEIAGRHGVEVEFAPAESDEGHKIGSSDIRAALAEGDIQRVNTLLGRRYSLHGPIIHGAERGRTIGFPTANLGVGPDRAAPGFGVYAACAALDAHVYVAAVNVGRRPTFDDGAPSIEAHLLDFEGDIYGRELRLEFCKRLRGEVKFPSATALMEQIARDSQAARAAAPCAGGIAPPVA